MSEPIVLRTPRDILLDVVQDEVSKYGVTVNEVLSRSRRIPVVAARHAAMMRLRTEKSMTYPQIARLFGVDHTSVLYAAGTAKRWQRRRATEICTRNGVLQPA